ncbi:hypothetical protein GCM10022243_02080 [Saccharothrix violaceirubra]|uniref:Uncharacterized protein n=1 Tax=Saccharothrix violaceirubra TaxID=413306 RepID=A0A7W7T4N7_9PSEU|nr:hypothetical protein [Saccharothrix violaceirubra]MBB4965967.1 hypothetical protein [Saccharothrix violaceirubra]
MTVEDLRRRHVALLRDRRVVDGLRPGADRSDTRYHTWTQVASEPAAARLDRLLDLRRRPGPYRSARLHDRQRGLDALHPELLHLARRAGWTLTTPTLAAVFPTGTLDGICLPVPGRGVLVLVDSGLLDLVPNVLTVMTGALPHYGSPPLLSGEQATWALTEMFNAYLYGNGAVGPHALPELSGQRRALVGALSRRTVQFVVAHELSHVVAGHLVHARRWTDPTTPVGALDSLSVGWPREHEADRTAATIMSHTLDDLTQRDVEVHEPYLVGAMLLPLFLHEMTDRLAEQFDLAVPFAGSHPPPVRRIQALVEHLSDRVRTRRALDLAADVATWLEDRLDAVSEWFRQVRVPAS